MKKILLVIHVLRIEDDRGVLLDDVEILVERITALVVRATRVLIDVIPVVQSTDLTFSGYCDCHHAARENR